MDEATMSVNGDTAHQVSDITYEGGPLATERAEARIRVDAARSDHAEKLNELNRLTSALRAAESVIERKRTELARLSSEHATQLVRTEAARRRLDGAEAELRTISMDKVRKTSGKRAKS